ncbi:MAG: radical SAM protein [Candidatus Saelkia tenebricola]|nr:radical SAM protein [Candidatus Saelkia tenebricola]
MKIIITNMPWKSNGLWGVRAGSRWPHLKHPYSEKDYLPYPFFLGYATSLLIKNGFQAEFIDAIAEQIEISDFMKLLKQKNPDLIVAETSTPSLQYDLSLLEQLRNIAPIVVCGPEYNMRNLSFLENKPFIDFVMVGEYEETLLELAQTIKQNKDFSSVKGLIYRHSGQLCKNHPRPLIKELDSLPWPHRNNIQMQNYVDAPGGMPLPSVQMWASRGCPYECIFCLWPHIMYQGSTYRLRNPYKVVDEMEYLIKEMGFKSIYIDDDTANVNKKFLINIAKEIKNRKLKFPWAIMARPDLMDEELLCELRSSGLYSVKYGVESAVQKLVDNANKNMDLKHAVKMIHLTNKLGIKTHLTFTFGLPGETKETIEETIDLAKKLNPYSVQFSITTPFPGTSYFNILKERGWEEPNDWGLFDGHKAAVINIENVTPEELENYLNKAYRSWFEHKNKLLLKKTLPQELKLFLDCVKLYGIKFAWEKKNSYLNVKKHMSSFSKTKEITDITRKSNDLLKGILKGNGAYCGPKIAVIDVTNKCNISCIGCWLYSPFINKNRQDPELQKHLDLNVIKNLVDELHKLDTEEIQITGGGEPLMHPEIFEIIKYIKARGMRCHLITNFTLFDKETITRLIRLGLNYITASLWAGDAKTYCKTHPGSSEDMFEKIGNNLKYLIKTRKNDTPALKIYNVISKVNYRNIPEMLDFALNMGVDYLEFQFMDSIPGKTDHLLITKKEAEEIEDILNKFKNRSDYIPDFISDRDLLIYDNPSHRKELSDFGRFLKKIDSNFQLINGIRMAKCPKGNYSTGKTPYPDKDVRHVKYHFSDNTCKKCVLRTSCYDKDKNTPFEVHLLTILGIETFIRRVNSIVKETTYLDGDFIDTLPCYAGWNFTRITTNGDVKPCCKADELILGNVKEKRFSHIWNSDLYDEFRHKTRFLNKKDKYFEKINCYKVCDNLGMNLMVHKKVLEHTKKTEFQKQPSIKTIYNKNKIIIPSQSFSRGNLNKADNGFGNNLVIDGGAGFGFAEYLFDTNEPGLYKLFSKYAAEIPRPVEIKIDGEYFGKIMKSSTSGWTKKHLKLFPEIEVYLKNGPHKIELFSGSYFPHFARLELEIKTQDYDKNCFCDPSSVYKKKEPLKLLKESFKTHGRKATFKRITKFLIPRNFINHYLDIIGVFDGEFAYKGPFHIQIDLTNDCNNDCIGCWCNSPLLEEKKMSQEMKKQYLPKAIIKELLDEAKTLGAKEVYYSGGGEPFMHPEIMQILEYTKKLGLICYVNTNFTLLSKEKIDRIIDIGVDHLTVSVWAGTPKTYARTHPNKTEATFAQIKENLTYLNKQKNKTPYIKLYQVIFNLNYHEIKQMIEFAQYTKCESVEFTLIDTIPGKTEALALNREERKQLHKTCQSVAREMMLNFDYKGVHLFRFDQFLRRISKEKETLEAKYDKNIIDAIPCYIGWLFARILPDGNINTCLKSHRFPVGNLYEEKFSQIWNSPKQIYCRKKMLCYAKNDNFFKLIGNDPNTEEAGCYKSCDDIGRNIHMHKKIMSLTHVERFFLNLFVKYKRYKRKKAPQLPINKKPLLKTPIKLTAGIINGRCAYQGPEHIVIDVTNKCQLKCNACWLYSTHLKEHKPSPEWLAKQIPYKRMASFIDEASGMGARIIRFTGGGEPLLYEGILDLLDLTKSRNIKTTLTTNFYNIKESMLKDIIKLNLDEMALSIWAPDAYTYTQMHPGTKIADFEKIRENITILNSLKGKQTKVTIANVITNNNFDKIFQMAQFAKETGADAVYFTFADVFKGETDFLLLNENQYIKSKEELIKAENYLKDNNIEIENLIGFKERIESRTPTGNYDRNRIDKIPCYVGWFFTRLLGNGEIIPCCRGINYPMGNIMLQSFNDIWYSQLYNGFRARAKLLKKTQPYFAKMDCFKECDNLMHNEEIHERIFSKNT